MAANWLPSPGRLPDVYAIPIRGRLSWGENAPAASALRAQRPSPVAPPSNTTKIAVFPNTRDGGQLTGRASLSRVTMLSRGCGMDATQPGVEPERREDNVFFCEAGSNTGKCWLCRRRLPGWRAVPHV
jgi:hypothetical protein